MEITMLTMGGVVVSSGYVAILLTTPYVNEEGEEEYSLPGTVLLAGASAIKWVYNKITGWIDYLIGGRSHEEIVDDDDGFLRADTEYEIVV